MEESATYQAIWRTAFKQGFNEGLAEGARRFLLLQGELRFGAPDASTRGTIEAIDSISELENLAVRMLSASSWQDLLSRKAQRRRNAKNAEHAPAF